MKTKIARDANNNLLYHVVRVQSDMRFAKSIIKNHRHYKPRPTHTKSHWDIACYVCLFARSNDVITLLLGRFANEKTRVRVKIIRVVWVLTNLRGGVGKHKGAGRARRT